MGEYAEYELARLARSGYVPKVGPVPYWPKVACPICKKECGGRGNMQNDGVHQHMRDAHNMKKKYKREALLEQSSRGIDYGKP